MQQRVGVHSAGNQQDDDIDDRAADCNMEQFANNGRHQRCRHAECSCCASEKRKYCQKVNDSASPAIGVLAQNRAAGFRVFLAGSFSYMQHKAECYRQHQIEAPRDKAPMEQGIYPCPVLNAAHLCQMGVGCIQHPFRKRVKQDIRSKTASKHHGAPCKEGILRLFVGFTQNNVPILRTRNVQ